ncbi:hypothetical protein ACLOAU_20555 [Niabella sp. CJ426]|uniref:hypothetical protein n=1 Tax=Niabella sp. CJ426 TaxID=3393740 RepID=UPI003D053268
MEKIMKWLVSGLLLLVIQNVIFAQTIQNFRDSTIVVSPAYRLVINKKEGHVSYYFQDGSFLKNTTAMVKDVAGKVYSSDQFAQHIIEVQPVSDLIGKGQQLNIVHRNPGTGLKLIQSVLIYKAQSFFILRLAAVTRNTEKLSVNYISPLALVKQKGGTGFINGNQPRVLDMPFDNDNWTKALTAEWRAEPVRGTGYSFSSLYDAERLSGVVVGAVTHDFWKTGLQYTLSTQKNILDSFIVYGGASTPDNSSLPAEYGGNDGTHDIVAHGAMTGSTVVSPAIFVSGLNSRAEAFQAYGRVNQKKNGALKWNDTAPFYWNSFGVEGVLGYEKRMMPDGVLAVSDYIASLKHFSANKKVYMSIDSYDQGIYNKEVLKSIREHCIQNNQELGFYFIPFAVWTWKSSVEKDKLQYTDVDIRDVTLKDNNGKTIVYKDGEFGAFPLDPTHPATRQRIIGELEKAKAIGARFLKIDFLTAGALESTSRYDKSVRSGLQAYNKGMSMLKQLIDSILGPDVFITQAISPTFPSQYTHIRFLSTDVYSHLRNDQKGFPHYGSTAASMITSSHLGWMQGSLWPYTNMDVSVMKQFQKNNAISEQDVKVRLITMAVMGSALGDGSDFRDSTTRARAIRFLNNPHLCRYFEHPQAFIPLKVADGLKEDQQLSFYLPGDAISAAIINFDTTRSFEYVFMREQLKWKDGAYSIREYLTNEEVGIIKPGEKSFTLTTGTRDALWVKLVKIN